MITTALHRWATSQHPVADRFEAWDRKLNEVYGTWRSHREPNAGFSAQLAYRKASSFQIVDCRCDPCGATRAIRDAGDSAEPLFALQIVLEGREEFCIDDRRFLLGTGDVLLWDTTKPMLFRVVEPLHKISAMIPLSRLRNWFPNARKSPEGKLESGTTAARLLSSYITSIHPEFLAGNLNNQDGLIEATIGLLINALGEDSRGFPRESLRDAQMARVKAHISENMDDPELSPMKIANACRISVRYLHWLFKSTETTVFNYVVHERLLRCRRALSNRQMDRRTITEIAYSTGFISATHFARRFKSEYGETPMEFRQRSASASLALLSQ